MLKGNQDKCPNCGKFIEHDADGFYDREWPYHDGAQVVQYCNEQCCDQKRQKDKATNRHPSRGTVADAQDAREFYENHASRSRAYSSSSPMSTETELVSQRLTSTRSTSGPITTATDQ